MVFDINQLEIFFESLNIFNRYYLTSAVVFFCERFFLCVLKFKSAYMREKVLRLTFAPQLDLPNDDAHCETL